jgi:hypothetical protein
MPVVFGLVAILALGLLFGPFLAGHVRHALNPRVFNDDVRPWIVPLFRYTDEGTVSQDIPGDYHLALMAPGFKLLYRTVAPAVDPELLSRVLPYMLLFVTLFGVAMAACRLGGPVVAVMTLALVLQTPHFLKQMMGGLPRGFAFAFISLGFWALVAGRVRALAALATVATAFYSVAAAVLGFVLGALLFILPRADAGEAEGWSWQRRLAVLVLTGSLMSALLVPIALATRPWGRLLGPGDTVVYPEIGRTGRYKTVPPDRMPFPDLFVEARLQVKRTLLGGGEPLVPPVRKFVKDWDAVITDVLLLVLVFGLIPLARQEAAARRALALPLAGMVGYVLARVLTPYLYMPSRYLQYTVPLFIVVLLPAGGAALVQVLSPARWAIRARHVGAVLAAGAVLVLLGGRGDPMVGYTRVLDANTRIYEFVRHLPKDVLVADWPGGVIQNVPYVSRRRVFITYEYHQPFHEGYTLEMRRRMGAVIDALFSDDRQGLMTLRDAFGVTHLIVDANHYSKPPSYFAPFDAEVKRTWQRGKERGFAVEGAVAKAAVFREGALVILDLSRL